MANQNARRALKRARLEGRATRRATAKNAEAASARPIIAPA